MQKLVINIDLPGSEWNEKARVDHIEDMATALRRMADAIAALREIPNAVIPLRDRDGTEIGCAQIEHQ